MEKLISKHTKKSKNNNNNKQKNKNNKINSKQICKLCEILVSRFVIFVRFQYINIGKEYLTSASIK